MTAFSSMPSDVAASKSPKKIASTRRALSAADSGASAPEARANSRCRVLNAAQLLKSHRAMAAPEMSRPH